MGVPRSEGKGLKVKRARTYRGICVYCLEPVRGFHYYVDGVGGSRVKNCGVAHESCYFGTARKVT